MMSFFSNSAIQIKSNIMIIGIPIYAAYLPKALMESWHKSPLHKIIIEKNIIEGISPSYMARNTHMRET